MTGSAAAKVIEVDRLRKSYGDLVAVEEVSFEVNRGEIFGILGPNGAGKTTTVEILQGLRRFESGRVRILGLDPTRQAGEIRRLIGSQLQDSALPDRIKVWEALDLFGSLGSGGPDPDRLLADWGLSDKRDARFEKLSGGQQQRLFVALALVNDPQIVFLDEMTTGLDPSARRVAWQLISRIRDQGTTVVLVTHFMDEAEALCDRLVVIDRGRVVAEGTPQGLIDGHRGEVEIRFTASGHDLDWLAGVPHVNGVQADGGRWKIRGSGPVVTHVAARLLQHGIEPTDLRVHRATLEDVFLSLTEAGDEGAEN